jgi:hypothetical protein
VFKKYYHCGFAPTVEGFNLSIASHAFIPALTAPADSGENVVEDETQ